MRWVAEGKGDVVISDVVMPDGNGLEMLPKIAQDRPGLPVIVISAQNTIMTAIKANEAEAYDYLPKPFDLPDLMKRTARALDSAGQAPKARDTAAPSEELPLIGRTPVMQALYRVVARVMNTDLPVLICGASGTGKSLIARAIHDFSDRRSMPFVVASPRDLVDLEGPTKLMARARGGTIVIEEIADLEVEAQGRLVRMMDATGDDQPRFMATTQISGSIEMQAAGLREDLYYRLGGAVIDVPSLCDRVDDIPLLVAHFLARSEHDGTGARSMSNGALELMRSYVWPGNVRQLENAVRRIALTAQGEEITRDEVAAMLSTQPEAQPVLGQGESESLSESVGRHLQRYFDLHGDMMPPSGLYARILREMEHPLIEIALDATGGNQAKCAELLGINRNTLRKKITELDIRVTRRRKLM